MLNYKKAIPKNSTYKKTSTSSWILIQKNLPQSNAIKYSFKMILRFIFAIVFYSFQGTFFAHGSAVPLTTLKTEHSCFVPNTKNLINLKCEPNEHIRVLDSFYGIKSQSCINYPNRIKADCKSKNINVETICNGQHECEIEFLKVYLLKCQEDSNYLTIRYECLPGYFNLNL